MFSSLANVFHLASHEDVGGSGCIAQSIKYEVTPEYYIRKKSVSRPGHFTPKKKSPVSFTKEVMWSPTCMLDAVERRKISLIPRPSSLQPSQYTERCTDIGEVITVNQLHPSHIPADGFMGCKSYIMCYLSLSIK